MNQYNYFNQLQKIKCPVLLIYGGYDPLYGIAALKIKASLKKAQLVVIDKAGHFPFIENKTAFY